LAVPTDQRAPDVSEIKAIRALLPVEPRPLGWAARREDRGGWFRLAVAARPSRDRAWRSVV